jgi:hypothetical protein
MIQHFIEGFEIRYDKHLSSLSLCTEQSPNESDETRCCYKQFDFLKMNTVVFETCKGM